MKMKMTGRFSFVSGYRFSETANPLSAAPLRATVQAPRTTLRPLVALALFAFFLTLSVSARHSAGAVRVPAISTNRRVPAASRSTRAPDCCRRIGPGNPRVHRRSGGQYKPNARCSHPVAGPQSRTQRTSGPSRGAHSKLRHRGRYYCLGRPQALAWNVSQPQRVHPASFEEARAASQDANRRLADIENRLRQLDVEIGRMQATAENEAAAEEVRIQKSAEEDIRKVVLAAEQEIATAAKQARRELTNHTAGLAIALASKQINVDSNTDQVLVRTFASKLTSHDNGGKDGQ